MSTKVFGAKAHLITIIKCKQLRTQEEVCARIKDFVPAFKTLSIACERHKEGDLHYHIFGVWRRKWQFKKSKWAPIREWFKAANDDYVMWNKKRGITPAEWQVEEWRYCNNLVNAAFVESKGDAKGQIWVANFGTDLVNLQAAELDNLKPGADVLRQFAGGRTLVQQFADADWQRKEFLCKNRDQLTKTITAYKQFARELANAKPEFTAENFHADAVKAVRDVDTSKKCIVISGPPGIGKTKLAKTLFEKPLLVRHPDKLKQFDENTHDAIIFDDQAYGHWPRESVIHLMDCEEEADINVKNSMVTIPAGIPRVFTTNRKIRNYKPDRYGEEGEMVHDKDTSFLPARLDVFDNAIDRRLKHIHFSSDIRKMPTHTVSG